MEELEAEIAEVRRDLKQAKADGERELIINFSKCLGELYAQKNLYLKGEDGEKLFVSPFLLLTTYCVGACARTIDPSVSEGLPH